MKKLILSIFVVFFFLFGSLNSYGQSTIEINKAAFENTEALKKQIKFDSNTEHKVYQSYKVYQRQMHHINTMSTPNSDLITEEKKKLYSKLCDDLKEILTTEQYAMFLEIEKH
jgi:hypothetical protein